MSISVEASCLDKFFLGPGSTGPIHSLTVSDEDLMEAMEEADPEGALQRLVDALPPHSRLSAILNGSANPPFRSDGRPDFVRVLVLLCWMQVSGSRPAGDRDFRDLMESHLNRRYQFLNGLNGLWEALALYLRGDCGIELSLPPILPHSQIGRTIRMSFPTWRDNSAMERLSSGLDAKRHDNRNYVRSLLPTLSSFEQAPTSLKYAFGAWSDASRSGDWELAEQLPFWRAWTSQGFGNLRLEAVEDAYGDVELLKVAPDGSSSSNVDLSRDGRAFEPQIARAVAKGFVFMFPMGLGRYVASERTDTRTLVVRSSELPANSSATSRRRALRGGWEFVTFARKGDKTRPESEPSEMTFGWTDGIRTGGALLGRWPLAPRVEYHGAIPEVLIDGQQVECNDANGVLELPNGVYRGRAIARSRSAHRSALLVGNAKEAHPEDLRRFADLEEISEDGALFETVPGQVDGVRRPWDGARFRPNPLLLTAAEGLYARSTRGLVVSAAFGIVDRCLEKSDDAPSAWFVLRSFIDAGWFDRTILRGYPAKRLLQRELVVRFSSSNALRLWLDGPMPIAAQERIESVATAAGGAFGLSFGGSEWSLPKPYVDFANEEAVEIFLKRADIRHAREKPTSMTLPSAEDKFSIDGYLPAAVWAGRYWVDFDTSKAVDDHLVRYESVAGNSPKIFVSRVAGLPDIRTPSDVLAVLVDGIRRKAIRVEFVGDSMVLAGCSGLPAAWARWLVERTSVNPGPRKCAGNWDYSYPSDAAGAKAIGELLGVNVRSDNTARWIQDFRASRSTVDRHIFDSTRKGLAGVGVGSGRLTR